MLQNDVSIQVLDKVLSYKMMWVWHPSATRMLHLIYLNATSNLSLSSRQTTPCMDHPVRHHGFRKDEGCCCFLVVTVVAAAVTIGRQSCSSSPGDDGFQLNKPEALTVTAAVTKREKNS